MKKLGKKILLIFLIMLLINNVFINSFSYATDVAHLEKRSGYGLSTKQRLAVVNAANYLQTSNFSFMTYCLERLE